MNNIEKILKSTLENNEEKINESIKDLANKINSIATAFGLDNKSENTLTSIKETALQLKSSLASQYYIAPSQLQQLEKIANRCDYISTHISEN
jgi:gas vesicle protein